MRIYGLVGIFALTITLLEGYPWLSMQRDDLLNADNPYSTLFSITNEGYFPVVDLDAVCVPDFRGQKVIVSGNNISFRGFAKYLAHSQRASVPCFKAIGGTGLPSLLKNSDQIKLNILIEYSLFGLSVPFLRRSKEFQFSAIKSDDGSLHWTFQN